MNSVHEGYDNPLESPSLNPTQEATLSILRSSPDERPLFDPVLGTNLENELTSALAGIAGHIEPSNPLFISKHALNQVHSCERRYVGESAQPFAWSTPLAKGSVAHKAIELGIHRGHDTPPLDLVDDAIDSLIAADTSLADWLATSSQRERDDLRALAAESVASFVETFPPIKVQWRPVTEGRIRVDLHGGRIILQGRTDLTLGSPQGTTARKVLIDFKTGRRSPTHLADLRFYALIETIRLGTPPRLLASYYLDAGRADTEAVTEGLLEAALVRTVEGATKIFQLDRQSREAVPTPGPTCRWCSALSTCPEGQEFLESLDGDGFD